MAMENEPFLDDFPIKSIKTSIYSCFSIAMFDWRIDPPTVRDSSKGKLSPGPMASKNDELATAMAQAFT